MITSCLFICVIDKQNSNLVKSALKLRPLTLKLLLFLYLSRLNTDKQFYAHQDHYSLTLRTGYRYRWINRPEKDQLVQRFFSRWRQSRRYHECFFLWCNIIFGCYLHWFCREDRLGIRLFRDLDRGLQWIDRGSGSLGPAGMESQKDVGRNGGSHFE